MDTPNPWTFAQFAPQIFYNLIARIVAGLTLIGTVCFLWPDSLDPVLENSLLVGASRVEVALFLGLAAYILSLLAEGAWHFTIYKWWAKKKERKMEEDSQNDALDGFKDYVTGFKSTDRIFPGIPIIYDLVRIRDPVAGARIVKIRAEVQLCRTLALGWVVILVILLACMAIGDCGTGKAPFVVFLAVAVLLVWQQYLQRRRRLCWSLYNHWLLLVAPGIHDIMRDAAGVKEV